MAKAELVTHEAARDALVQVNSYPESAARSAAARTVMNYIGQQEVASDLELNELLTELRATNAEQAAKIGELMARAPGVEWCQGPEGGRFLCTICAGVVDDEDHPHSADECRLEVEAAEGQVHDYLLRENVKLDKQLTEKNLEIARLHEGLKPDPEEDTPEAAAFWRAANGRWTDWADKVLGYRVDANGIMPGDDGQRERIAKLFEQRGNDQTGSVYFLPSGAPKP